MQSAVRRTCRAFQLVCKGKAYRFLHVHTLLGRHELREPIGLRVVDFQRHGQSPIGFDR